MKRYNGNYLTWYLLQIWVHCLAGHWRGDHASEAQQLGRHDEGGHQDVSQGQEWD